MAVKFWQLVAKKVEKYWVRNACIKTTTVVFFHNWGIQGCDPFFFCCKNVVKEEGEAQHPVLY